MDNLRCEGFADQPQALTITSQGVEIIYNEKFIVIVR